MTRFLLASLLVFCSSAAAIFSCTATPESGCVSGPCGQELPAGGTDAGKGCYADWTLADKCDVDKMAATDGDIPCDVWAVLHKEPIDDGGCHKCHQNPPKNGAPFPELTYSDLLEKTIKFGYGKGGDERVFQSMLRAIAMNAGLGDAGPSGYTAMPFATSQPLTCADSLTLSTWLANCAIPVPKGTGSGACCLKQNDAKDPDAGCPKGVVPDAGGTGGTGGTGGAGGSGGAGGG